MTASWILAKRRDEKQAALRARYEAVVALEKQQAAEQAAAEAEAMRAEGASTADEGVVKGMELDGRPASPPPSAPESTDEERGQNTPPRAATPIVTDIPTLRAEIESLREILHHKPSFKASIFRDDLETKVNIVQAVRERNGLSAANAQYLLAYLSENRHLDKRFEAFHHKYMTFSEVITLLKTANNIDRFGNLDNYKVATHTELAQKLVKAVNDFIASEVAEATDAR